jgi:putative transposase
MEQKKVFKYRFYPTQEQKRILAKTFGCVRYVYNWALRTRTDLYYQQSERWYYAQMSTALTLLKKQDDHAWLTEVSSVPTQQALRHLDKAFIHFFEGRAAYPTFKKKHNDQSAEYTRSAFKWDGKELTLAKMDEPLAVVWSRPLPEGCNPTTVTVTKDEANRYCVSLVVEQDIKHLPVTNKMVGLDLGIKSMVITSDGHSHGNLKFFAKDERKLAKAQRRHAKKQKGSKNRGKARLKVARIHKRIADRRRDYQHKLSTQIIRENQVVCVESLQVKNMLKNHHLAKAISDVGWGEFVRQLAYKATWYGRVLVKIDKFYPSSKRCHHCGHILDSLDLVIRFWQCPECHTSHDRDINAAKNILAAGLAVAACGEAVRPGRVKAQPGTSQRSRKPSR